MRPDDTSTLTRAGSTIMRQEQPTADVKRVRRALESILKAARFTVAWTEDVNEHRLWADKMKRAAVERQFEVVSEALRRVRDLDPVTWDALHDVDAAAAIRLGEAIRRDYDDIDYGILWRATRNELPRMIQEVELLLSRPGQ
jgi:uncharacterized protein with HEPN domain